MNSRCATEDKEKEFLIELLGNKEFPTKLVYCGSINGWNFKNFHDCCDGKGPTVSLFKIKDGDCIGGYTSAKWSSEWK